MENGQALWKNRALGCPPVARVELMDGVAEKVLFGSLTPRTAAYRVTSLFIVLGCLSHCPPPCYQHGSFRLPPGVSGTRSSDPWCLVTSAAAPTLAAACRAAGGVLGSASRQGKGAGAWPRVAPGIGRAGQVQAVAVPGRWAALGRRAAPGRWTPPGRLAAPGFAPSAFQFLSAFLESQGCADWHWVGLPCVCGGK